MAGLVTVGGGATGVALASEVTGSSRWLSRKLINLAVRKAPERRREVRREEWNAEWEAWDGSVIGRLGWALCLYFGQSWAALRARKGVKRRGVVGRHRNDDVEQPARHRDIGPINVTIGGEPVVTTIDFRTLKRYEGRIGFRQPEDMGDDHDAYAAQVEASMRRLAPGDGSSAIEFIVTRKPTRRARSSSKRSKRSRE